MFNGDTDLYNKFKKMACLISGGESDEKTDAAQCLYSEYKAAAARLNGPLRQCSHSAAPPDV